VEYSTANKNFALIGAAGYVAPKHMQAIRDTGCDLLAIMDPKDSVGIIDHFFPLAAFFTEFERFDRHIHKLNRSGQRIDYLSICSPNYLHDAHIRFGARNHIDVICEKPLVLNPWNIDNLEEIAAEEGTKIYSILQLRLHSSIITLKERIDMMSSARKHDVDLTYITSRGHWYYASWKGDITKSGGIATNIGIHLFDMLIWVFGEVESSVVHLHTHDRAAGLLELKNARVRWFLSIDAACLPHDVVAQGKKAFRSLSIDGSEIDFTEGFTNLHTQSYREILSGNGFNISESRSGIELVYSIRQATPSGLSGDFHPLAQLEQSLHPFKNTTIQK
jgi:UDP-N-acetyl-2-amino-2-deoxyglucuronate dehydrogenase